MPKKPTPKYRFRTIYGRIYQWLDERDGASVAICEPDGADRDAIQEAFRLAKSNEIEMTSARPLLVYGTHCTVGESERWRFIQLEATALNALEREVAPKGWGINA